MLPSKVVYSKLSIFILTIIVLLNLAESRFIDEEKARAIRSTSDVNMEYIMQYLQQYGHLKPSKQTGDLNGSAKEESMESNIKNGIKSMQTYLGVEANGILDEKTKEAVLAPRCGMSDAQNIMDTDTGKPYQWEKKRQLTYAFENYYSNMEKSKQRFAIRQGFNRWSTVSGFKFREVTGIKNVIPDLWVGFFSKCHDDPDCFDGPRGVLAHGYYPEDGHLHFDQDETWGYPDTAESKNDLLELKLVDLLEISTHEIGHTLGVDHIPNRKAIMFPAYIPKLDINGKYLIKKMSDLDKEKIQEIYGPEAGTGVASRGPPILLNRQNNTKSS